MGSLDLTQAGEQHLAHPGRVLHQMLVAHGVVAKGTNAVLADDSHPYLHVDMSQCVTCYRCERICD